MTQIRHAENQAHVRMGDQAVAGVNDERNAPGADPNSIDDIADELEIDLRHYDAGRIAS